MTLLTGDRSGQYGNHGQQQQVEKEDEEDYMSMTFSSAPPAFTDSRKSAPETSLQRRARMKKEGEMRGRIKSKAELAAEERERREEKLSRSLLEDPNMRKSKAFRMMEKMGFQAASRPAEDKTKASTGNGEGEESGGAQKTNVVSNEDDKGDKGGEVAGIGVTERQQQENKPGLQHTAEPIRIRVKEDRAGIGHDTVVKRKLAEHVSLLPDPKKAKLNESSFRDRVRREREAGRNEKLVYAAQKVAEKFHDEATGIPEGASEISTRSLKSVPVLWRALVREREERTRTRKAERELDASLSSLMPGFRDEGEYDEDDRRTLGRNAVAYDPAGDLDEEDQELEAFRALKPAERLERLVRFLRSEYQYCFWCKYRYEDEEMEGCPGLTEEEHD